MEIKDRLADGNAAYRKTTDPGLVARLSNKQEPFIAVLSCSDPSVVPEKIFNLSLGDAFVVRVAGNSASNPSTIGALEYAVKILRVRAILVLGHTGCGAVKAAVDGGVTANFDHIARDIERARMKVPLELASDQNAISEANVRLQLRQLEDNSQVIMQALNEGTLKLMGAMYDTSSGAVRFV
jgi:carbonic anhydrase